MMPHGEVSQHQQDEELELKIGSAYSAFILARTLEDKETCLRHMATLIAQRSPGQVARMEIDRFGRAFG